IAMDPLRQPIGESTRAVTWLPEGIGLEERELDWLRNMGDWMISKKRYYGLALPIWECIDCDGWEVIGSEAELRDRAVAGWDEFDGHTPHRPWIDAVEIECRSCGSRARRIADVGNPWLDAGIVGLSTLRWTTDRDYWREWYPADFTTESFPGQFRNWFYALLTEGVVTTGEPPMRTVFGYALLRDEHGEEMHKSKGNAIWFDDAAEQIGSDVMRWMFASATPSTNMNFGYHLAHEEVRRFFLPLWNAYGFFITYARLDGWTPLGTDDETDGTAASRTLLDRWILSRLDALIGEVGEALDGYDAQRATRAIEAFVDDLSNWYVRRNRRRFWKGELDDDKRAAYETLHRVLVDLTGLLAPFVPHLADALWQNLVTVVQPEAPDSVHLADFPHVRDEWRDEALEGSVDLARRVIGLGRTARAASKLRTRQPLAVARIKLPTSADGSLSPDESVAAELTREVLDELNVKAIEVLSDESEMVERTLYPLLPVIGPRHGQAVGAIMAAVRAGTWHLLDDGRAEAGGVVLASDEFQLTARARPGHEVAEEGDLLVALDTQLSPDLEAEGLAREVAHRLQTMRRTAGFEISDRVLASVDGEAALVTRLDPFRDWLAQEILATELRLGPGAELDAPAGRESMDVAGGRLDLALRRA
ncbi:MAG TPA: class I tRNA ligase family protein, partial [Candidatus Limnocylindrales bacterium]|nr:class I tRNA ligase family protein [Candidatus Limnocylindrales bacterium]